MEDNSIEPLEGVITRLERGLRTCLGRKLTSAAMWYLDPSFKELCAPGIIVDNDPADNGFALELGFADQKPILIDIVHSPCVGHFSLSLCYQSDWNVPDLFALFPISRGPWSVCMDQVLQSASLYFDDEVDGGIVGISFDFGLTPQIGLGCGRDGIGTSLCDDLFSGSLDRIDLPPRRRAISH